MNLKSVLGLKIKRRRQDLQLSQEEFSNEIGLSVSLLRDIEHGRGNPTLKTLEKIFSGLGMEFESLFVAAQPVVTTKPEDIPRNIALQLKAILDLPTEQQTLAIRIFEQLVLILQKKDDTEDAE